MFYNLFLSSGATGGTDNSTLAGFLSNMTTIITTLFAIIGDAIEVIMSNPFLYFTMGFLVLGGCIGIIGRLISRG